MGDISAVSAQAQTIFKERPVPDFDAGYGSILVTEMTGSFTLLVPMLLACFAAMAVPTLSANLRLHEPACCAATHSLPE
jgi:hypothetical protein